MGRSRKEHHHLGTTSPPADGGIFADGPRFVDSLRPWATEWGTRAVGITGLVPVAGLGPGYCTDSAPDTGYVLCWP